MCVLEYHDAAWRRTRLGAVHERVDRGVWKCLKEGRLPVAAKTVRRRGVQHLLHRQVRHASYEIRRRRTKCAERREQPLAVVEARTAVRGHDGDHRNAIRTRDRRRIDRQLIRQASHHEVAVMA